MSNNTFNQTEKMKMFLYQSISIFSVNKRYKEIWCSIHWNNNLQLKWGEIMLMIKLLSRKNIDKKQSSESQDIQASNNSQNSSENLNGW